MHLLATRWALHGLELRSCSSENDTDMYLLLLKCVTEGHNKTSLSEELGVRTGSGGPLAPGSAVVYMRGVTFWVIEYQHFPLKHCTVDKMISVTHFICQRF